MGGRHLLSSAEGLQEAVLAHQDGNPDYHLFTTLEVAGCVAELGMAELCRRIWLWVWAPMTASERLKTDRQAVISDDSGEETMCRNHPLGP